MKKKTQLLIAAILSAFLCNAQNNSFSVSIGPSLGLPFNSEYSIPWGLTLKPQLTVTRWSSVYADVTYLRAKSVEQPLNFNVSMVNCKVGYTSYLKPSKALFITADAGLSAESYMVTSKDTFNYNRNTNYSLITGAGLGYSFRLKNNSFIDLIPTVNYVSNPRSISRLWCIINMAYRFNVKTKK